MNRNRVLTATALVCLLLGATCPREVLDPVEVATLQQPVTYVGDVKPVLDSRCVVCHSCYNAPCQLKLNSFEGTDRGGSKAAVYSSSRLSDQQPTRLFFDASSTDGWRKLGFHSVTQSTSEGSFNDSIMLHLLAPKVGQPVAPRDYHSEAQDLTCAADTDEVSRYLSKNPGGGMPFGFPSLSDREYATVATWLQRGAAGPSPKQHAFVTTPSPAVAKHIEKWEAFLNQPDPKHAMTARYLYEHFFLAHLAFTDASSSEFYRIVRSTTRPGEPISVIATRRPYDDPGVDQVFYRLERIHETIVYKTHMVVEWNDEALARYQELFIEPQWNDEPHVEEYGDRTGANPFLIYAQIPPDSRYRFLLDHSEYMIRTFIRGPVCKGQVALNVIQDHFWVMFLDPKADHTVLNPDFLVAQADNLRLPTEEGSDESVLKSFSNEYRDRYAAFYKAKSALYEQVEPQGHSLDSIWKGRRPQDGPLLTVYRHFDSASVHKGVLGDLPRTAWVIDYSQFERIYYALVAGFDVFGNVSHQVNVRRYMDYLRVEGELNFAAFMPAEARLPMLRSWYLGTDAFENVKPDEVSNDRPTRVVYQTDDYKRELFTQVVTNHIVKSTDIAFDPINYNADGREVPMPTSFTTHEDILNGFRALTAPGTGFIERVDSTSVNVIFVRIKNYAGSDRFFSIAINRWHDNVNSMFGEASRRNPAKDTIDFLPGGIGSYPNYFFDLEAEEVPDLFDLLANFDGSPKYVAKIDKYGVNRADPKFWEVYDWFQAQLSETDPLTAGLYDLNRYYPKAQLD